MGQLISLIVCRLCRYLWYSCRSCCTSCLLSGKPRCIASVSLTMVLSSCVALTSLVQVITSNLSLSLGTPANVIALILATILCCSSGSIVVLSSSGFILREYIIDGLALLDSASAANCRKPGTWTTLKFHQNVFSLILRSLGLSIVSRALSPKIKTRG